MKQGYTSALVVVKQTAYEMYRQLKARGQAPLALRWERLEQRDSVHRKCVEVRLHFIMFLKFKIVLILFGLLCVQHAGFVGNPSCQQLSLPCGGTGGASSPSFD